MDSPPFNIETQDLSEPLKALGEVVHKGIKAPRQTHSMTKRAGLSMWGRQDKAMPASSTDCEITGEMHWPIDGNILVGSGCLQSTSPGIFPDGMLHRSALAKR